MFQAETFTVGATATIDLYTGSSAENPVTDSGQGIDVAAYDHSNL